MFFMSYIPSFFFGGDRGGGVGSCMRRPRPRCSGLAFTIVLPPSMDTNHRSMAMFRVRALHAIVPAPPGPTCPLLAEGPPCPLQRARRVSLDQARRPPFLPSGRRMAPDRFRPARVSNLLGNQPSCPPPKAPRAHVTAYARDATPGPRQDLREPGARPRPGVAFALHRSGCGGIEC